MLRGILYFSEGINEDYEANEEEFKKRLILFIADFEKIYNTKVHNFQIHKDEVDFKLTEKIGNIHVHLDFNNFDYITGKSLSIGNNKLQGQKVQDLCFKHFKDFGQGYERGIKKDKSVKHLPIHEYIELQEAKKLKDKLLIEVEKLKSKNQNLKTTNDNLKKNTEIITHNNKKVHQDNLMLQKRNDTKTKENDRLKEQNELLEKIQLGANDSLKNTLEVIVELGINYKKKDLLGLYKLIVRYMNSEDGKKLAKLEEDLRKTIDKIEKSNIKNKTTLKV